MKSSSILFAMFFLSSLMISQDSLSTSPKVEEYLEFLKTERANLKYEEKISSLGAPDLEPVVRMFYEASEANPEAIEKHPSRVRYDYLSRIKATYSKRMYAIVDNPFVLRVAIDSLELASYTSTDGAGTYDRTIVHASVLDAFKGGNRYPV
ncbi:MAG TPA: hypothetical protein VKS81_04230, partial [Bacteroidota bacterium]|nr:hypothetical protein [Bacteroidota bacterium]